jgi:carbamoyl-phosphate synthase large subunit
LGYPVVIPARRSRWAAPAARSPYNREEFAEAISRALDASPVHEALVEESVLGWKEFELEVMRDLPRQLRGRLHDRKRRSHGRAHRRFHHRGSGADAHRQGISAHARRRRRDHSRSRRRNRRLEHPVRGRSRDRAPGGDRNESARFAQLGAGLEGHRFPIAKIAARLAVGYTLDEIPNDITRKTPSCFEPTIDYVVVKIPKFQFEKFPGADTALGTQMASVGEVMAIGRTFKEALQKGIRSLEPSSPWRAPAEVPLSLLREKLATARPDRIHWLLLALERGLAPSEAADLTKIDPWFIRQIEEIASRSIASRPRSPWKPCPPDFLREAKRRRQRRATRAGLEDDRRGGASPASQSAHRAGLQARGHLRRRIRVLHAVHVLDLRGRGRGRAERHGARSPSWAAARTASGRESNSIIAAATRPSRCAKTASRRS